MCTHLTPCYDKDIIKCNLYKITHSYMYPVDIYVLHLMNGMTTVLFDLTWFD